MVGIKFFGQFYHGGICFCENITQEIHKVELLVEILNKCRSQRAPPWCNTDLLFHFLAHKGINVGT